MPILAMSAGTVTAVWGNAFVRLPNGSLKPVQVGDKVKGGERIITDDDGIVEISPAKGASVLVKATAAPEVLNKAIAGIENQDPEQTPAVGLTGGAEGGMQPGLRVERVSESVGQLAFDFGAAREQAPAPLGSSSDQRLQAASAPLPQASIDDVDVNEAVGSASFTITLDKASLVPVTLSYTTLPGSAVDGDFTPTSGTVTFNPGETSKIVSVPVKNDAVYEGAEQFSVKLSSPANAVLAKDTGMAKIHDDGTGSVPDEVQPDDDRPHVLSVSDAKVTEGGDLAFHVLVSNSSTTATTLTLKLSGAGDQPATPGDDTSKIEVAIGGGARLSALIDADGNITFPLPAFTSPETDIVVYVSTKADGVEELAEGLQLSVTTPYDAVGPSNTGFGVIEDEGTKPYMLVLNGEPAVEGDPVIFNVVLTRPSLSPITVKLALADGVDDSGTPENESATLGIDTDTQLQYEVSQDNWADVPSSGLLTFEPKQTLLKVRVATSEDEDPESTEYIKLIASVVEGETLNGLNVSTSNQTAITDNDQPPTDAPYMLVQHGIPEIEGAPVEFHLVLTHATTEPITVKLSLANGEDDPDTPENERAILGLDTGTQLEYEGADGTWLPLPESGLLTFEPLHTELHVRVSSVDDKGPEATEFVKLVAAVVSGNTQNGLSVSTSNQTAITDNDLAPVDAVQGHVSATNTNLMIVLDTSGSMNAESGILGLTRMEAAIKAINNLLDRYEQFGDVAVRLVTFSTNASVLGSTWLDVTEAKASLNLLEQAGDGATYYNRALSTAKLAFETIDGRLEDAQNVAYFLSDGIPTEKREGTVFEEGRLSAEEQLAWLGFVDSNQIKSYAIGMGGDVSQSFLDGIAFDGQAVADADGVVVSDFAQLDQVLSGTANDVVQGSVSAGGALGQPGSEFQSVSSIVIDGVDHPFQEDVLTLHTSLGGLFSIDMSTGQYSYAAPAVLADGVASETIGFSLINEQGQTSTSTLSIQFDHAHVVVGTGMSETLSGQDTADWLMGRAGNDVLIGGDGHDQLLGNGGQDELHGDAGDDLVVGGSGSDMLFGGAGSDVFAWHFSDRGNAGTVSDRAIDTIKDFDAHEASTGGDILDLRDLLQGENLTGDTGNLDHYLQFDTVGESTVIKVAATGDFVPGEPDTGTASQLVVIEGGHFLSDLGLNAGASNLQIIAKMLQQGNLLVDHA